MESHNDNLVFYLQPDFQEKMLRDGRSWHDTPPEIFPEIYLRILAQLFNDALFC